MDTDALLAQLRKLEVALHQLDVCCDQAQLDALLHESFLEFGRSGRRYNKADILQSLPLEAEPEVIWSQDFTVARIADGAALLTYRSANLNDTGVLSRYTLRSSLWQQSEQGWQMRFHQGTPTDPFARSAT